MIDHISQGGAREKARAESRRNRMDEIVDAVDVWLSTRWPLKYTAFGKTCPERRARRLQRVRAVEFTHQQKIEMSTIILGRRMGTLSDGQAYSKLITQLGKAFSGGLDTVDPPALLSYFLEALTKIESMKGEIDPYQPIGEAGVEIMATQEEVPMPTPPEVSH